jgi:MFS superfamily sulfate permease-like transporter
LKIIFFKYIFILKKNQTKLMNFKTIKNDIPSGLVVFLVALPLCLGIALASGAPFFSGIISGIIGGIIVGSVSSSKLSVSGPAAGLAALVLAAIINIGNFPLFLCAVLIAGILQILMSLAQFGGIANYFPSSVVKGMLTSIGILIIAKQIPHALGYDKTQNGELTELLPFGDIHEIFQPLQHIDIGVLMICVISILIMLVWERPAIKSKFKFIPGALVAVIVAIIISEILKACNSGLQIEHDHLVNLKIAKTPADFLGFFTLPDFNGFTSSKIWMTGVMIAIIATLESLLCIEAVDNLDPERNVTNTNRELLAQGIGNIVSGLVGGLPITSVIVRSSANINAGAKSKVSAIFHGLLLLICVIAIPSLLNKIPLSALAAILLLTGYKLCKISVFKQMIAQGKYQYIPFLVTVGVILSIDLFGLIPHLKGEGLLIGVVCGLVSAIGTILLKNLKNAYSFHGSKTDTPTVRNIELSEEVSFLNKAAIRALLDEIPANTAITIDASDTFYIDYDVLELIKEFKQIKAPLKNITCNLIGFKEIYKINNIK